MITKKITKNSSFTTQVGGDHYGTDRIQPIDVAAANNYDFFEGSALKYLDRYSRKEGAKDLKKCMHYVQMILELKYGVRCTITYEEDNGNQEET